MFQILPVDEPVDNNNFKMIETDQSTEDCFFSIVTQNITEGQQRPSNIIDEVNDYCSKNAFSESKMCSYPLDKV